MLFHRNHIFWLVSLLFVITGCTIFTKNPTPGTVVDPLVERTSSGRYRLETCNSRYSTEISRRPLAAYEAGLFFFSRIPPDVSESTTKKYGYTIQREE